MPVFRSDRERRMLGDRILARKSSFTSVHSGVAEVLGVFRTAHTDLMHFATERQREESEDERARVERGAAVKKCRTMYGWAYQEVDRLLTPSWDDAPDEEEIALVRASLFPLGSPSQIAASEQLTLDAMSQFLAAEGQQQSVRFPRKFRTDAKKARDNLAASLANVTRESGETDAVTDAQVAARARWDRCFTALREVTTGFLRLEGREAEIAALFRALPSHVSTESDDSASLVVPPEPVLEPEPA